jgi:hypothetical protein
MALYSLNGLVLVSRYEVHVARPLLLATDGHDNAILLDSGGLCVWTVTQIVEKCHPLKIKVAWPAPPIRLIPLGHDQHAVVCSGGRVVSVGREGGGREWQSCP